jgi:hypothetical protein
MIALPTDEDIAETGLSDAGEYMITLQAAAPAEYEVFLQACRRAPARGTEISSTQVTRCATLAALHSLHSAALLSLHCKIPLLQLTCCRTPPALPAYTCALPPCRSVRSNGIGSP